MNRNINQKLNNELQSFQNIWKGGYFTGYSQKRNQQGIEDYLKSNLSGSTFLEIGCGGGQWSKLIYNRNVFEKMYCVDALSDEHNKFWNYLGEEAKSVIDYKKVSDFTLDFIDDNSIDYVFSYDVFCHISYSGINAYLDSLARKCRKGCKLLIMYADPEKYLDSEPENRFHVKRYLPNKKFVYNISDKKLIKDALLDADGKASEGRWYWVGMESFLELLNKKSFKVTNKDLNIDKTNIMTLFEK